MSVAKTMTKDDELLCSVAGAIDRMVKVKPEARNIPILLSRELAIKLSGIIKEYYKQEWINGGRTAKTDR